MEGPSLENRLVTLLEAERAGVAVARAMHGEARDSARKDLMAAVLDGERFSCRALGRTMLGLGLKGSGHTGDFAAKVLALEDPRERLELLIRGQEWVVRKVLEALETDPAREVAAALQEIREVHAIGIGKCRAYLENTYGVSGSGV